MDELVAGAPVDQKSWDDVLARAREPRRWRLAVLGVATAVIAIAVATPAFGIGSRLIGLFDGTPVDTERLSPQELHALGAMAKGFSPRVPASKQDDLTRVGASSLRQIATRDGRAYFVADRRGGGLCVTIGSIGDLELFGDILCSPDFPSAPRPILDRSSFRGPLTAPHATRLEGFATDGVEPLA